MLNDIPRCHYSSRDVTLGMSHDVTIHQEMSVNIRWFLYTSGDVSIHQVMSLYIRGCPHTSGDVSIHQMSLYIKCTIHHTMPVYIMWCPIHHVMSLYITRKRLTWLKYPVRLRTITSNQITAYLQEPNCPNSSEIN